MKEKAIRDKKSEMSGKLEKKQNILMNPHKKERKKEKREKNMKLEVKCKLSE